MTIDRSGKWWKGSSPEDALEYLQALSPGGYSVDEALQQSCVCGSFRFSVFRNQDDELAYLICSSCKTKTFVTDSEDHVEKQKFKPTKCPCKNTDYQVFLGVHSIDDTSVANWMSIGTICAECGVLASPLDWEFDTDKTEASYAKHLAPLPSEA